VVTNWKKGNVTVQIECNVAETASASIPVSITADHTPVFSGTVKRNQKMFSVEITIPHPKPWSPERPNLHTLAVSVGEAQKSISLGLRQIKTRGSQILLNDKPIRLRGVNRHDSCILHGFTVPDTLQLYDVQKIKELGCNFVRTSHYPPSETFIDLCDRYGLLVWCEATSWGYDEAMTIDPRMAAMQRQCICEMIHQYAHHPSIICWGFFNECASASKKAKPIYKELSRLIRRLDPSRPITYATNFCNPAATLQEARVDDLMFDCVDWISINVYPGWYQGTPDDAAERLENLAKKMQQKKFNKPIIVSEIGGGGITGYDHYFPVKWSLSYQNLLLGNLIEYIRTRKLFTGAIIWHYSDIFTSEDRWQRRPKQYNDKGLLDEYRREKPAFETVRQIFNKKW
jgi:beta-glucuronidase